MSDEIVIDASAIIALLEQEKGAEIVEKKLNGAIVSSVNFSEIVAVINRKVTDKKTQEEAIRLFTSTFQHVIDFDKEQAMIVGKLDQFTKQYGLSLGDRACLALAQFRNLPVLTAEKNWQKLKIDVDIQLIR